MAKTQHEAQSTAAQQQSVNVSTETAIQQRIPTDEEKKFLLADNDTMTVYDMTVGQMLDGARADITRILSESKDKDAIIAANVVEITRLTESLAAARKPREFTDDEIARAVQKLKPAGDFEKLADGSVNLWVTLDVDEAAPLLSWADSAGEDPGEYIAKVLKDALVAVVQS